MKIFNLFSLEPKKKISKNGQKDQKQEALVKLGREQFKKLRELGLRVPVAFL